MLIKELITRRRQLIDMRTQEMNREKLMTGCASRSCLRIIKYLNQDIERIETASGKAVEEESVWAERKALLASVPGVGNTLGCCGNSGLLLVVVRVLAAIGVYLFGFTP